MLEEAKRLLLMRIAAHWIAAPIPGIDGSGKSPDVNGKGWQRSAIRTFEQLASSYRQGYNLGIHCGFVQGAVSLIFIDIDSDLGLLRARDLFPDTPLKTQTRQGEHWGYLHPGENVRIASQGIYIEHEGKRTCIGHVRADGGNIVCAPSIHQTGFVYREIIPWTTELLSNVPPWSNKVILDPWRVENKNTQIQVSAKVTSRSQNWAQAALEELCQEMQTAAQGTRNVTLNGSAYRAGRLVAGGHLTYQEVERKLAHAAQNSGLELGEIRKSLSSGLEAGKKSPHPGPSDKPIREAKPTTYICASILRYGNIALGMARPTDFHDPLERSFIELVTSLETENYSAEFDSIPAEWDALAPHTTVAKSLEHVEYLIQHRPPPILPEILVENPNLPKTEIGFFSSAAPDDAEFKDDHAVKRDLLPSVSHNELAIELINRLTVDYGYKPIYSDGNFWIYKDGIWEKYLPDLVALMLDGMPWGSKVLKGGLTVPMGNFVMRKSDLVGILDIAKRRVLQDDFFEALPGIAFRNGFTQIGQHGIILRDHSPYYRARHRYDFDYNPNWQCSLWGRTLGQLFANNRDAEERKKLLQEFAGAAITGQATKYQKFLILTGKPGCGKSVVFEVLRSIFPEFAVSSVAPQDMGIEYRRVALVGKLLNCRDDINENSIQHVGDFKSIVTGTGKIQMRDVGEKQFDSKPIAAHMYTFNNTPHFYDPSGAFIDRICAIEFTRRFRGTPNDNKHLAQDILSSEKPEIVAWALEGAWRLWYQGGYTIPPSSLECVERWSTSNDPVQKFVEEKLDLRAGQIRLVDLYDIYRRWAKACGYERMLDLHAFTRGVSNHGVVNGDYLIGRLI